MVVIALIRHENMLWYYHAISNDLTLANSTDFCFANISLNNRKYEHTIEIMCHVCVLLLARAAMFMLI